MAQPNIDKVEIVEPPIQELTKRHGGVAQGCVFGCLFLVILAVGLFIGIKIYLGSGPGTITYIPASFPREVPIYDKENIERINLIPGKYKTRSLRLSSIVPRLLLSPLLTHSLESTSTEHISSKDKFTQTWLLLSAPVDADERDTVRIEWQNAAADPAFIKSFYLNALSKAGFTIIQDDDDPLSLSFNNDTISGTLVMTDTDMRKLGTDAIVLTVSYYE